MALVAFGQIVGILRFVVEIGKYYQELDAKVFTQFPITMWGEAAMNAGLAWLFVYTTVLMFDTRSGSRVFSLRSMWR